MFPSAEVTHVLPQFLDLAPPGRAVHEQVVAGLPHVLTAPPAVVGRQLVDFIAQVDVATVRPAKAWPTALCVYKLAGVVDELSGWLPRAFMQRSA